MAERATPIGKPRGILRGEPRAGAFQHERVPPAADLAPFVEHFWFVSWDLACEPYDQETLPHPSVHVVFEREGSRVAGVSRGRFSRRLEGRGSVFGIKFRPGGFRPFVSFPVSRLTDRVVPLADVFGEASAGVEVAVLDAVDVPGRVAAASAFLRRRLPPRDEVAEEVAAVVRRILDDRDLRRVDDVVRGSGRGLRALQRLFLEYVGVSPKWVLRRYRLHEAIARLDAGDVVDWPALALSLGYFDQAHFIRDFKSLVGRTPGDYGRLARSASRA